MLGESGEVPYPCYLSIISNDIQICFTELSNIEPTRTGTIKPEIVAGIFQ